MNTDTKKIIDKLKQKDKKDVLEVEHLLELLHKGNKDLIEPLTELKSQLQWKSINDDLIVPFGAWADIVCAYLEDSYDGLVRIGKSESNNSSLAISALSELKTEDSIKALYNILSNIKITNSKDLPKIIEVISSINLIMSFKDSPIIDKNIAQQLNNYIAKLINHLITSVDSNEHDLTTCVLALRGLGDNETVKFIKQLPALKNPENADVYKIVIAAINKRI